MMTITKSQERSQHLLTLTGDSEPALREVAQTYATYLQLHPDITLADLCYTRNTTLAQGAYRLAVVAPTVATMREQLIAFSHSSEPIGFTSAQVGSTRPKLAFLFTGQGSQYIDMGRHLYETQPTFRDTIHHCNKLLANELEQPLLDILYSPSLPPGDAQAALINQTAYTQPALFVLEYALAKLWQSWGIQPDIVMGHSIGEYVAACIAGVFSLADGLKLVAARGRLMQALPAEGAMAAVMATADQVATLLAPHGQAVSIAAINGPQNVVISGSKPALQTVTATLEAQGIKVTPLAVSHAFHSPLMEPMLSKFAQVAAEVNYSSPQIPVVSNVSGKLASDELTTPDYWCQHIRQPVQFAASMETLHQQGCDLFLEIGPRPVLLGMGRQCLPEGVGHWLPSLRPGQADWQQMLMSLGELYVQGINVDWQQFDQDYPQRHPVTLPSHSLGQRDLLETLATQKQNKAEDTSQSAWMQQLEALPEAARAPFLRQTLQQMVGQILAGLHPTGSGTELQQHIPEDMLNRPFRAVVEWYKYFGIDLQQAVSALKPGATVLDVCCGYGVAANTLAQAFPHLQVTGVDLQPDATQVKKYLSLAPSDSLPAPLVAHDACEMTSIAAQSIDFCYCMAGIAYVPDGLKMLQEVYRVLKPGATALFYIMRRDDDIAADISLSELTAAAEGGEFTIHPFSDQTREGWASGIIPRPYYEDGVILEMTKNSDKLMFPFKYEGSATSLQTGQRSMEAYYVVGRYSRYSLVS